MDDARGETEAREAVEGPGGSKLAPEGNSNARLFVPQNQEEHRQEQDPEQPQDQAGAPPQQAVAAGEREQQPQPAETGRLESALSDRKRVGAAAAVPVLGGLAAWLARRRR